MQPEAKRTLRGALAGATAAAVWALQQPLDRRVFGVPYDDDDLLAGALIRNRANPARKPVGLALHVINGAAFGAAYARTASRLPAPAWARGPLAALAEHAATWPLVAVVERTHPGRDELPPLWGSGRAFAQAAWRHLLFGLVLGELERRLNQPAEEGEAPEMDEERASSNGHGAVEAIAAVGPRG